MSRTFLVVVGLLYVFMLAPLVVVVVVSFNAGTVTDFPPSGLSFRWYAHALSLDLYVNAIITSVWLGLAAAALSTPLGLMASIGIARGRFPGRDALQAFFLAPLATPGIVVGIALLVSYAAVGLRDAPVRLLLAHVLITFPFSVRTILASLSRLDPSLEEAAATLGAKPVTIFWRVTLPLIQPGIAAGAIFSFVMSFDNIPVSIFLTDVHTNTIPIAIMSYLEYNFDPSIAAVSSILIVGSLALGLFLERIFGLRRAMGM